MTHEQPASEQSGWEHFSHDADIGVRGYGRTIAESFEQAALALTAIVTEVAIKPLTEVRVSCQHADIELLFVTWLDAIVYEMAVRKMVFGRFAVEITGDHLSGRLWGEPVDVPRHQPACEPKGATLTALKVERDTNGLWSAACVIDV